MKIKQILIREMVIIGIIVLIAKYAYAGNEIQVGKKIQKAIAQGKKLKPRQIKKIVSKITKREQIHKALIHTSKIAQKGLSRCADIKNVVKATKTISKAALRRIPGIGFAISLAMPRELSASTLKGVGKVGNNGGNTP